MGFLMAARLPVVLSQPLKKGVLRQIKPRGPALRFQWNPETVRRIPTVGRWSEEDRPHQKPAVEWAGQTNERLTFTLRLDGYPSTPMDALIRVLEGFGRKRGKDKPPPELEFDYGPGERGTRWVLETIEYGDELRNARLQIVRQFVTVTLLEYTEANVVITHSKKHNEKRFSSEDNNGDGGNNQLVSVREGDTLSSIAARILGDPLRWTEIADLNELRDPDHLEIGQRLILPSA
jgi:hypothetical protein